MCSSARYLVLNKIFGPLIKSNWEAITAPNASELNFIHPGYHLGEEQGGLGTAGGEEGGEVYYQPEPTLLTIASGEQGVVEEQVKSLRQFRTVLPNFCKLQDCHNHK